MVSSHQHSPQTFVAKHLKNSIDRPSLFIMSYVGYDKAKHAFVTICNANDNSDADHMDTIIEDFDLSFYRQKHLITSPGCHCNGIICMFSHIRNDILLCNPTLGEFKVIVSSCFDPWSLSRRELKEMVGFGHDSSNNVHKVVRLVCEDYDFLRAEICTLGIGHQTTWRTIESEAEFCTGCGPYFRCQDLEYKGIIYWLASGCCSGHPNPVIVSFDVHDEKIQPISLPALELDDGNFSTAESCLVKRFKLVLWKESVALFKMYIPRCLCGKKSTCSSPKPIEMWVMHISHGSFQGAGKSYFWTKHLTIPSLDQVYFPLVFWKNDELILKRFPPSTDHSCKFYLASYNLGTQKVRSLQGIPNIEKIASFAYVQSLVSINY